MRDPPYLTNVKLAKLSAVRLHHIKYSTVLVSSTTGEQDRLGEARVYGTPGNGADLRTMSVEVNAVCLGSPHLFFFVSTGDYGAASMVKTANRVFGHSKGVTALFLSNSATSPFLSAPSPDSGVCYDPKYASS